MGHACMHARTHNTTTMHAPHTHACTNTQNPLIIHWVQMVCIWRYQENKHKVEHVCMQLVIVVQSMVGSLLLILPLQNTVNAEQGREEWTEN